MGRKLRVEPIIDTPNRNRVRVPESMVNYMCGAAKKTRNGKTNAMRRASNESVDPRSKKVRAQHYQDNKDNNNRDENGKKVKNTTKSSRKKQRMARMKSTVRLGETETKELERGMKRGYLTLSSTGYRRGRKCSSLANAHREWCDQKEKPQIILCKASGGRRLDNVVVDLSPLRVPGRAESDEMAAMKLATLKEQILEAGRDCGLVLRSDYVEDNTHNEGMDVTDNEEDEDDDDLVDECPLPSSGSLSPKEWERNHIINLPVVSVGVFEGERAHCKSMVKSLSALWDTSVGALAAEGQSERSSKNKKGKGGHQRKGLSEHRRRSRNPWNRLD